MASKRQLRYQRDDVARANSGPVDRYAEDQSGFEAFLEALDADVVIPATGASIFPWAPR